MPRRKLRVLNATGQEIRAGLLASKKENRPSIVQNLDRTCKTGPSLVPDGCKTTPWCMENARREDEIVGGDGKGVIDLMRLLGKDTMRTPAQHMIYIQGAPKTAQNVMACFT